MFDGNSMETSLFRVLSTAFLITGNTVGAGVLILPELAEGPGMGIATSIFVASFFLIHLVSGLIIAEIAINQHANSGDDVPSSFKDFAQVNLNSKSAAVPVVISSISIFVNGLVMAFNTVKVGAMGAETFQGAPNTDVVSFAWVAMYTALVGSQTFSSLSRVTSVLVAGLFALFAGILFPGLAHMTLDPIAILSTPGISSDTMASAAELTHIDEFGVSEHCSLGYQVEQLRSNENHHVNSTGIVNSADHVPSLDFCRRWRRYQQFSRFRGSSNLNILSHHNRRV